jgi:hypothetical protein
MFRLFIAVAALTLVASMPLSALPLPNASPPIEEEVDASVHVPDAPTQFGPYAFYVFLEMSPAAARLLAAKKEQVVVSVEYRGEPTKAAKRFADPGSGLITLANEQVRVAATTKRVAVTGRKVLPAEVARIEDSRVEVLVNVSSARLSASDNLLNCEMYDDLFAYVRESGSLLKCKLLTE